MFNKTFIDQNAQGLLSMVECETSNKIGLITTLKQETVSAFKWVTSLDPLNGSSYYPIIFFTPVTYWFAPAQRGCSPADSLPRCFIA